MSKTSKIDYLIKRYRIGLTSDGEHLFVPVKRGIEEVSEVDDIIRPYYEQIKKRLQRLKAQEEGASHPADKLNSNPDTEAECELEGRTNTQTGAFGSSRLGSDRRRTPKRPRRHR